MKLNPTLTVFILLLMPLTAWAEECRTFPQQVLINNHVVQGEAAACEYDDGSWRVKSFTDMYGNNLPVPSQILYPQPAIIMTQPQTAFTPRQAINDMPMPHVTFYQQ